MINIDNLKLYGLTFSLFLISLDAYTIFNVPFQWIGLSTIVFLFVLNFKKIYSQINTVFFVIIFIIFTPILFEIFNSYEILFERDYQLRVFNFVSFFITVYVSQTFLPSISQEKFMNLLGPYVKVLILLQLSKIIKS